MTDLKALWEQYDEEWAKLTAIPIQDRQAYKKEHGTEKNPFGPEPPEAQAIIDRLRELSREIEPLQKDFEADLQYALGDQIRKDPLIAHLTYAALCNVEWSHDDGSRYSCSWRYAGGLVAEIRNQDEDYIDFYCGGNEGEIDERIEGPLAAFGWHPQD